MSLGSKYLSPNFQEYQNNISINHAIEESIMLEQQQKKKFALFSKKNDNDNNNDNLNDPIKLEEKTTINNKKNCC